jgi:peptide/nickel transport system substrate-binding protein
VFRGAALALAGTLFSTLAANDEPRKNAYTQPHVLRMGDIGDLTSLNPMFIQSDVQSRLGSMTMAWLTKYDHANRPVPELAMAVPAKANGGVSADGKTITFHLRKDARWSDGAPFNADDVVFTTKIILDSKTRVISREGWDRIVSIDEPDKYTVIFHLKEPYSPFSTFFSSGTFGPAILPKHLLEHSPDINTDPYNAKPIGIGPFRYLEWRRGDRIILEANPYYFRGSPKLQRIEYRVIPSRDTLFVQMQTGELDLWVRAARAYYTRLSALPNVMVLRRPSYIYNHLDFNLTHPVLQDIRVRRALALAIDRVAIKEKIGDGLGIVQDGVWSPASPYFDSTIKTTPFDVATANKLLEAAGWKRTTGDYREKDGQPLTIEFVAGAGTPDIDAEIELIRSWWKSIGVDLELHEYNAALLFAQPENGGILYTGKFDVALFAWNPNAAGVMIGNYGCNDWSPHGQNVMHWCNRAAQSAMDRFVLSYDPVEQHNLDDIVQEQLASDMPIYVMHINEDLFAMNSDLQNFHPNTVTPFDDMMNVDI